MYLCREISCPFSSSSVYNHFGYQNLLLFYWLLTILSVLLSPFFWFIFVVYVLCSVLISQRVLYCPMVSSVQLECLRGHPPTAVELLGEVCSRSSLTFVHAACIHCALRCCPRHALVAGLAMFLTTAGRPRFNQWITV